MKKKELRKRIEDGFSELAPEIFEAVMEAVEEQKLMSPEMEHDQPPVWTTRQMEQEATVPKNRGPKKSFFSFAGLAKDKFRGSALAACASLALLFVCFYAGLGGEQKAVYLTLDINPSIQIKMDESLQVKQLKGLNQDGKDVVRDISWKKKEPVVELLDDLIQDVAEKSYLHEDSGILMTLCAQNTDICDELADTLGEKVDQKLLELEISDVTVAFLKSESASALQGRVQLESELMDSYGVPAEQVQQMSVSELIMYCQEHTSLELGFSENSSVKNTSSLRDEKRDTSLQGSDKKSQSAKEDQKQESEEAGSEISSVKDSEKPGEDDTGKNLSEQKESESRDSKSSGQSENNGIRNGQKPKEDQKKPQQSTTNAKPGENAQGQTNGHSGSSTQAGSTEQTNASTQTPQTNPPQNPAPPSNPADTNHQSGSDDENGNKDKDKNPGKDNNKDKDKDTGKDKDKNSGKDNNKDKDKDTGKDKDKNPGKDNNKDKDKDTGKDKDKNPGKDNNKDKDKNPGKDNNKDTGKDKDKNPGKDNNKDKDKDTGKDIDENPGKGNSTEKNTGSSTEKNTCNSTEKNTGENNQGAGNDKGTGADSGSKGETTGKTSQNQTITPQNEIGSSGGNDEVSDIENIHF